MRIEKVAPPPLPPVEITMTFSVHEAWAVKAALQDWVVNHPGAAECDKWLSWAKDLERLIR